MGFYDLHFSSSLPVKGGLVTGHHRPDDTLPPDGHYIIGSETVQIGLLFGSETAICLYFLCGMDAYEMLNFSLFCCDTT